MRNAVIGLIIGIVAGIVLGTTAIAPHLTQTVQHGVGAIPKPDQDATKAPATPPATTASKVKEPDKTSTAAVSDAGRTTRLHMASAFPETLAGHGSAAKRLERTVWRISDGTLDLRFHPPGALVGEGEALNAVISGAIDAYFTETVALAARESAFTLFAGPPFGSSVAAYLGWMAEGGGRILFEDALAGLELQGVICGMIPRAGGGWFRQPLRTVDDLKGLRVRASGVEAALYRRLGTDVIDLPIADTLVAMESGLLGGAVLSAPNVDVALGAAREGATYYVPGWHTPASTFVLLLPLAKWDALSTVQKTRIRIACGDNLRQSIAEGEALQFGALKTITAKGADVQPWPAEIRDAMHAAWLDEAKEMQKSNRVYARVLKSYRQFVKGQTIWDELSRQ